MFNSLKENTLSFRTELIYQINKLLYKISPLNISVSSIEETLDQIILNKSSVIRFGDGEIMSILGENIQFQKYDKTLSQRLESLISMDSSKDMLVCLPDIFSDIEKYNPKSKKLWAAHRRKFYSFYRKHCVKKEYGNAFISRPYYIFKDKSDSNAKFAKLKKLWEEEDILIVEGKNSRSGVGNDLFLNSKSISRIICPSVNAFTKYDEILEKVKIAGEKKLILLMLGPSATIMAYDLNESDYWAIDLGHIDSEYEWYKRSATKKIKIPNKHTAEFEDTENDTFVDKKYQEEIIYEIK
ncbi:SP_1767 family glycosyltransferase [Aerococcus urinaeequi]|uniref:SP_1767 family glycosyltransferase n=1 Tax=Aerococcus urinaeequi TaxID=51665 RepID=UPI003AAB2738